MGRTLTSTLIALLFVVVSATAGLGQDQQELEFRYEKGRWRVISETIYASGDWNKQVLSPFNVVTSDINDSGWRPDKKVYGPRRVYWRAIETDCHPCRSLVANFNSTMDELLVVRYRLQESRWLETRFLENARRVAAKSPETAQADHVGPVLEVSEGFKKLREELRRQEGQLAGQAQRLRQMISDCEKQCQGKITKTSGIKLGGLPALEGVDPKSLPDLKKEFSLPFAWNGPYPEHCPNCAKLAQRLNALPDWARHVQFTLARIERSSKLQALEHKMVGAISARYGPIFTLARFRTLSEYQYLEDNKAYLRALKRNFEATLALYNDCAKSCKTKTACYEPERDYKKITIGPNDKYGSGAKLKEQASGLLGGKPSLGGGLGGGGFGLGGKRKSPTFSERATRGGQPDKKPEMVDDPTTGAFFRARGGEVDMDLRGNFTDDGLLVSANLTDVPGDGSFHAMWLEDDEGRIIQPTGYLPFSMWREWWLKVWWTYDRWVDGQHVEHREGGWTETWREERDGLLAYYGGEEGVKNSIWHGQGFDTPVRGLQHIGALFPVTVADLIGPCPLRLVTHVALPEEDPVVTQPVVSDLSVSDQTAATGAPDDIAVNIQQTFTF